MASPPRDPFGHSSPGSPGGTSSSQAFIYPIRAAVSVRAPPSEDGSSRSSKTGTTLGNSSRAGNQDVVELRNTDLTRTYSLGSSSSFAGDDSGSEVGSTGTTGTGDIQMVADKRAEVLSRLRSEGMDPEEAHDHRKKTLMTTRFKHIETPEGHMVVTGQEGLVTRCEDEVSGAVLSRGRDVALPMQPMAKTRAEAVFRRWQGHICTCTVPVQPGDATQPGRSTHTGRLVSPNSLMRRFLPFRIVAYSYPGRHPIFRLHDGCARR